MIVNGEAYIVSSEDEKRPMLSLQNEKQNQPWLFPIHPDGHFFWNMQRHGMFPFSVEVLHFDKSQKKKIYDGGHSISLEHQYQMKTHTGGSHLIQTFEYA